MRRRATIAGPVARTATILLVAALLAAAAACGGNGGGSSAPDPSTERRVALQVSPTTARPGSVLGLRVVATGDAPYEYGLGATLQRRGPEGAWEPTHRLSLGDPSNPGRHAPIGESLPIFAIAYADPREWRITLPPGLAPGTYRVVAFVTLGDDAVEPPDHDRVTARSPELTIAG
ncbi:MAG: hypothetical protein RLN63_07660 [Miltoncostaeaceae bacterium]